MPDESSLNYKSNEQQPSNPTADVGSNPFSRPQMTRPLRASDLLEMDAMRRAITETLRLYPPLILLMRKVSA